MEDLLIDLAKATDDQLLKLAQKICLIESETDRAVEILNLLRHASKVEKKCWEHHFWREGVMRILQNEGKDNPDSIFFVN